MRIRRRTLVATVLLGVLFTVFEVGLRLVQSNCYTALPYRRDALYPALPRSATFCFINSQRAHIAYATDSAGARRASRADAALRCRHCVMAVGDSQALGYGLAFADTFAARYAARHARRAVLVAAPADDPDYERLAAADYVASTGGMPDVALVVVNFGNDLDELLLGRASTLPAAGGSSWLLEHSFVFQDVALAGRIVARKLVHSTATLPGINPVAFGLEGDEVPIVAAELARDVALIVRASRARDAVAVVIPPDTVLDAREFSKYRRYYTAAEYAQWRARLPSMTLVMTAIEDGLERQLRARGIRVLDTRRILARIPAELAFDRFSHHLSPLANRSIADALR